MPNELSKPLSLLLVLVLVMAVLTAFTAIAADRQPTVRDSTNAMPATSDSGIPMPTVHIEYSSRSGVRLSGRVPDQLEHDALMRWARSTYGASAVIDAMDTGGVANPSWLSPAFLPDLRGTVTAQATLHDGRLDVVGFALSASERSGLTRSLERVADRGILVDARLDAQAQGH